MVVFNRCEISEDGKCLIVEAEISNMSYFTNCWIEKVYVDTDETYNMESTSEKSTEIDLTLDRHEVYKVEGKIRSVRLFIKPKDLNLEDFNKNIFFIRIKGDGYPEPGSPCGMDEEWSLCATVNYKPLYNIAMGYIKELSDNCSIPKNFLDTFLRFKAIHMAVKSGHFTDAIDLWQRWNMSKWNNNISPKRRCGCHGYN